MAGHGPRGKSAPACYDALLSRNRRFDGWFFVGVATTGV
ncbi:hypothetical protein D7S96_37525, partial [Burkholderia contaminans]|nr:hypothetical protein [Burkholderia contaminans]MBX3827605.1 hypothetical protein [Burkholderia contaminans]